MRRATVAALLLLTTACAGTVAQETAQRTAAAPETHTVTRVIDGDTLVIDGPAAGDTDAPRVRLIGLDAPEDTSTKECYGAQATAALRDLTQGRTVLLEEDPSQGDQDRYGRLLRYVLLPAQQGQDVGLTLIRGGYAREYTYDTEYRYQESYRNAQSAARQDSLGLWQACPPLPEDAPSRSGGGG